MAAGNPLAHELSSNVNSGVTQALTPSQMMAQFGSSLRTASRSFGITFRGHHIAFNKGVPVVCDAALIAALTAAGAPVS
jgi:hypothetical protein